MRDASGDDILLVSISSGRNRMKKRSFVRLATILAATVALLATACPDPSSPAVKDYTVTFASNGGSDVAPVIVKDGTAVTEPAAPTKAGYVFQGWFKDEACTQAWAFATDVVTADITLYAKWGAVKSITYVMNHGDNASANPATYVSGTSLTLAAPTRFCRVFDGWYESSDFSGTAITAIPATASDDKTLYAKWKWADYDLRDRGPANGWIVQVRDDVDAGDPNASDTWKYLEVRSTDLSNRLNWPQAVSACEDLIENFNNTSFDDWRLPLRIELGLMNTVLEDNGLGDFIPNASGTNSERCYYWSSESSSNPTTIAYVIRVFDGLQGNYNKNDYNWSVRAVRQF